jgi:hypothetical protein
VCIAGVYPLATYPNISTCYSVSGRWDAVLPPVNLPLIWILSEKLCVMRLYIRRKDVDIGILRISVRCEVEA